MQKIINNQRGKTETITPYRDEVIMEPIVDHYFSRIVDQYGNILIETSGMGKVVSFGTFAQNFPVDKIAFQSFREKIFKRRS